MEVILATGFGHYVNMINGEADELTEASEALFSYMNAKGSGMNRTNSTIIYCKLICHQINEGAHVFHSKLSVHGRFHQKNGSKNQICKGLFVH